MRVHGIPRDVLSVNIVSSLC